MGIEFEKLKKKNSDRPTYKWYLPISEGAPYFLPILEKTSLFGISEFPYISYTSPYWEFQISLPKL